MSYALVVFFFSFILIQLSHAYPKELLQEIERFCEEAVNDKTIKKDYFWYFRSQKEFFSKSSLVLFTAFIALSFLTLNVTNSFEQFIFLDFLILVLLISSYIDFKTQILPDTLHPILISVGLLFSPSLLHTQIPDLIFGLIGGYLITYLTLYITSIILKKEAMGMGDVKLISALGALIGLSNMPVLLLLSSLLAGIYIIFVKNKKVTFAFGPFISMASIIIIFLNLRGINLLDFYIY